MKVKLIVDAGTVQGSTTLSLDMFAVRELRSAHITFAGRKKEVRILRYDGYIILWDGAVYEVIRPADKYAGRYFWHPTGDRKVAEHHSTHVVLRYSLADMNRSEFASYNPSRYSKDFWHPVRVVFDPEANWVFEPEAAVSSLHYQDQAALAYFDSLEDDEPRETFAVVYQKGEQPCSIKRTFWLRPDYQLQPANAAAVYDLVLTHKHSPILDWPAARILRWPYVSTDGRMVLVPTGVVPVEPFNVTVDEYTYTYAYVVKGGG